MNWWWNNHLNLQIHVTIGPPFWTDHLYVVCSFSEFWSKLVHNHLRFLFHVSIKDNYISRHICQRLKCLLYLLLRISIVEQYLITIWLIWSLINSVSISISFLIICNNIIIISIMFGFHNTIDDCILFYYDWIGMH